MRHLLRLVSFPRLIEHPFRSFLTVVGIALGVAANVSVQMILATMTDSFSSMIDAVAGKVTLQVSGGETGVAENIYDEIQDTLRNNPDALPGLSAAMPTIQAVTKFGTENVLILAVDTLNDKAARDYKMTDADGGEIDDPLAFLNSPNALLLNREFARKHNVQVDQSIDMMTSTGKKSFIVRGLLDASGPATAFGGNFALMDVYAAQIWFGREGMFDSIDLIPKQGADLDTVRAGVEKLLAGRYEVRRPEQRNEGVQSLLASLNMGLMIMTFVVLAMGGFIIFNTMTTSVYQRLREFGLLRMVGVTRASVWALIATEAVLLGAIGSVGGTLGGYLLGRMTVLHYIGKVTSLFVPANATHAVFEPHMIVNGTLLGLGVTLLGALWPAWRATRVSPLQVVRYGPGLRSGNVFHPWRWLALALPLVAATLTLALHPAFHTVQGIKYAMGMVLACGVAFTPLAMYVLLHAVVPVTTLVKNALLRLAAENLLRDLARSAMTVAAFMVALGVLLEIYLFMGSMRHEMKEWMDQILKADIYITSSNAFATRTSVPIEAGMTEKLESIPGVTSAVPVRIKLQDWDNSRVVLLACDFKKYLDHGRLLFPEGTNEKGQAALLADEGVMLAQNLVRRHPWLESAKTLTIDTPHGKKEYRILGQVIDYTAETGAIVFNRTLFIKDFNDDLVDTFHVFLKPGVETQDVRQAIDKAVGDNFNLFVLTNREFKSSVIEAIDQVFALAVALEVLTLIIAIIGIINNLLSNVIDRTREIGVLRSLGATKPQVRRIFLFQSALMGLTGALVGLAAGWGVGIIHLKRLSIILSGWSPALYYSVFTIAGAFVMSVVFAAVAGLVPAAKAANLQLREALKYE